MLKTVEIVVVELVDTVDGGGGDDEADEQLLSLSEPDELGGLGGKRVSLQ